MNEVITARTFKTEWFVKAAKKADIKDRENITKKELQEFREIADMYAKIKEKEIELALENEILVEICHGKKI